MSSLRRKVALVLEYDGTSYAGFQRQANAPSIQGVVENACQSLTGERPQIRGAGRTDAGVHAMGQVATFETESGLSPEQVRDGLNHFLPVEVAVSNVREVPLDFDARRHAISRVYRYSFLLRTSRSPLRRRFAHLIGESVDLDAMRGTLACLEGIHDFAPFSGSIEVGKSTVRHIYYTSLWTRNDEVYLELEGNAFLPQQVRRMAGALLEVGLHRLTAQEFQTIADSGIRGAARWVLPAHGLCLCCVHYELFSSRDHAEEPDNHTRIASRPELTLAGG